MKRIAVRIGFTLGLALLSLPQSGPRQPADSATLYRHHFAGTARIAQAPNSSTLRKVWALPESKALRDHVFLKLAEVPYRVRRPELPAGAADQSALFRPLLDDLFSAESYLEIRGPTQRSEVVLALKLGDDRARVWSTNLWQAGATWKLGAPAPIKVEGFPGWELKMKGAPNVFQWVRAGQWLLVGLGHDRLTLLPGLARQTAKSERPGTALEQNWFEADVDCPRLSSWFPVLGRYAVPPAHVVITAKGEMLRSTAQLRCPEKVTWTFEPWKLPTNYIHEPLISFTVAQGIAHLLAKTKGVPELGLKPLPNQVCLWGQAAEHVQTAFTVPTANATNVIRQLAPRLQPFVLSHMPGAIGEFEWITNMLGMHWKGVPFVLPTLRPVRDTGVEYLLGSLYPVGTKGKPVPAELYAQLAGQTNLLYYDWEMTSERLPQANRFLQLGSITTQKRLPPTNAPTLRWLKAVSPLLGNTGTKMTQTGPNELTLVRSSQLGLTGIEMATLTRWIESPGFPLTFDPPPSSLPSPRKDSGKPASPRPQR